MQKSFIAAVAVTASAVVLSGGVALAQSPKVTLPSPGLTPDSTFYFLDRWGENLQQFFTFNQEAKARLQLEFAAERIAEIKAMLDKKGDETKGIDTAKSLLLGNVAFAADIINKEKASGKNVAQLAKDIDGQFDEQDKLLVQTFLDARGALIAQYKEIKEKSLKDAQAAGDTARVAELTKELSDIEKKANGLQDAKDEIKKSFRDEQKDIEQNLDQEDQQQDQKDHEQQDQVERHQEGEQGEFESEQGGDREGMKSEQRGEAGSAETNQKEEENATGVQKTETPERY